jgi:Xaa-Pro aminopeptidase
MFKIQTNFQATNANRVWLSKYVNAELAEIVPVGKQLIKLSPISLLKSVKNDVEAEGMRQAHLRDSVAIIAFLKWIEDQIVNNETADITEISASAKLLEIRRFLLIRNCINNIV